MKEVDIRQCWRSIHVRGLQAQGVDSAQYGMLLIPIMMAKIPKTTPYPLPSILWRQLEFR